MNKKIKQLYSTHPKGIQEFIKMDLFPALDDLIDDLKENVDENTASKNGDWKVEDMYDLITGHIFALYDDDPIKNSEELREEIRAFGKMRYNQALKDVKKLYEK